MIRSFLYHEKIYPMIYYEPLAKSVFNRKILWVYSFLKDISNGRTKHSLNSAER